MSVRLASIDIGRKNFSQYIEDINVDAILDLEKKYNKLPKSKQRKIGGVFHPEIEEILNECFLTGKRVQTGVYDFTEEEGQKYDDRVRENLIYHLEYYSYLWKTCDIFAIEEQYHNPNKGRKGNFKNSPNTPDKSGANAGAIRMAEAVFVWFKIKYPKKVIFYFPSSYKTQILGAPGKMKDRERKKWSSEKAEQIYIMREDEDMMNVYELSRAVKNKRKMDEERVQQFKDNFPCETEDAEELADKIIRERQKLDDFSDGLCQAQAVKYATMIACFYLLKTLKFKS